MNEDMKRIGKRRNTFGVCCCCVYVGGFFITCKLSLTSLEPGAVLIFLGDLEGGRLVESLGGATGECFLVLDGAVCDLKEDITSVLTLSASKSATKSTT